MYSRHVLYAEYLGTTCVAKRYLRLVRYSARRTAMLLPCRCCAVKGVVNMVQVGGGVWERRLLIVLPVGGRRQTDGVGGRRKVTV